MCRPWGRWRKNSSKPENLLWRTNSGSCGHYHLWIWWRGFLDWEVALTSSSYSVNHVLIALQKLSMDTKIIKTTAIIDCGAIRNFINLGLLSLANFPLWWLEWPVKAYNVDGTTDTKGNILWETQVEMWFPNLWKNVNLIVLSLGWKQIILGMPWLCKWNSQINWVTNTLTTPWVIWIRDIMPPCECLTSMTDSNIPQWYLLRWLGLDVDQKISKRLRKWEEWLSGEPVGKITISIQIAQSTKAPEQTLPEWCKDFKDVFFEETHDILPPHWAYNHTIDLLSSFTPKIAKIYSLNPQEMETCKNFVKEHLKTGCIVPSKSP